MIVPGGDVGVGSGAGEDEGAGGGVGTGDGDGSDDAEGSGVGEGVCVGFGGFEGFGDFDGSSPPSARTRPVRRVSSTGSSVLAAIADDTALMVRAMVRRTMALAWRTRLRRPLELPAT